MSKIKSAGLALALLLGAATPAFAVDFNCTPSHVGVFTNRIHVLCTAAATDGSASIRFFAVPTSNTQLSNRFLTTAATALASGRSLQMKFTAGDTSGTSFGCGSTDCRSIWGFLIF